MTVLDWVAAHSRGVPAALSARLGAILGHAASKSAAETGAVCLVAATRALGELLATGEQGRDIALQLLAIDALTTFAFEHASEVSTSPATIMAMARDGAHSLSQLAVARG